MPQMFSQLMHDPGATSPTPFTPEMEKSYNDWRSQKMADWIKLFAHLHSMSGAFQDADQQQQYGKPIPKLQAALQMYQTDSPGLRQMFMNEHQVGLQQQAQLPSGYARK